MKRLLFASLLLISGAAYSQASATAVTPTEADAQKLEAKKKADAEKAKLPKPYHPEENAEDKIADLIKIAKKETIKF